MYSMLNKIIKTFSMYTHMYRICKQNNKNIYYVYIIIKTFSMYTYMLNKIIKTFSMYIMLNKIIKTFSMYTYICIVC